MFDQNSRPNLSLYKLTPSTIHYSLIQNTINITLKYLNMAITSSFIFLLLTLTLTLATADLPPSTPVTPTTACNSTIDPTFCKTILPPKGSQNLYSYSRFSVDKSLSNARKFLFTVNQFLARSKTLSLTAVRALQDCQLLASLNIDFLTSVGSTLNSTSTLLDPQTEKLQTLLSALLTNHQTCLEGIQAASSAWSVRNGLSVPLSNGTKLYSVSLSLFNRAWVPMKKQKKNKAAKTSHGGSFPRVPNGRKLLFHEVDVVEHSRLPFRVRSESGRRLFEERSGRRLLQSTGSDAVEASEVVVVSQDGSGNFTTITDAVNSAPNKTDGSNGYYLIYVTGGVYQEYVMIPKYKSYVMMIGDGINQTVITGNHNNVDGWTTFNSATLG